MQTHVCFMHRSNKKFEKIQDTHKIVEKNSMNFEKNSSYVYMHEF